MQDARSAEIRSGTPTRADPWETVSLTTGKNASVVLVNAFRPLHLVIVRMDEGLFTDRFPIEMRARDPWEREVRELLRSMDRDVEAVIVEGPNDATALRTGGVTVPIHHCAMSTGIIEFATGISVEPLAILTDFDQAGRALNGQLRELIPPSQVESRWRRDLGLLLTQRGHYDIESLNNVFDRRF